MSDTKTPAGGTATPVKQFTYSYDPHGSTSLLVDEATGQASASYGYTPYGNQDMTLTKGDADQNSPLNPYRYTAKRFDSGSKTIDMGARRFSPDTGRFNSIDTYQGALDDLGLAADPLGQNRYALAAGNPLSFVETDGHMVAPDGGGGGTAPPAQPTRSTASGSSVDYLARSLVSAGPRRRAAREPDLGGPTVRQAAVSGSVIAALREAQTRRAYHKGLDAIRQQTALLRLCGLPDKDIAMDAVDARNLLRDTVRQRGTSAVLFGDHRRTYDGERAKGYSDYDIGDNASKSSAAFDRVAKAAGRLGAVALLADAGYDAVRIAQAPQSERACRAGVAGGGLAGGLALWLRRCRRWGSGGSVRRAARCLRGRSRRRSRRRYSWIDSGHFPRRGGILLMGRPRDDEVVTQELRTGRALALTPTGTWRYRPWSFELLAHGFGQVIGGQVHAAYFDPASGKVVLRRGEHACALLAASVSVTRLKAALLANTYAVACGHGTEHIEVRFGGRAIARRTFGLYDPMEEDEDDLYAYLARAISPDWVARAEGVWDLGFGLHERNGAHSATR
ncbi:MAG: hypothetical protein LC789_14440 [Actinobacteria bacterium]|nr:hypothetical protein [Actinomycetota bacterium]MCA1720163.1 hypothetical protein [Actinomycetota bacterium]